MTIQLKDHDEWRPTDPRIVINPENWGNETEPQACEDPNWDWKYNASAMELLEWVPNNEEWQEKIDSGWRPEKLEAISMDKQWELEKIKEAIELLSNLR